MYPGYQHPPANHIKVDVFCSLLPDFYVWSLSVCVSVTFCPRWCTALLQAFNLVFESSTWPVGHHLSSIIGNPSNHASMDPFFINHQSSISHQSSIINQSGWCQTVHCYENPCKHEQCSTVHAEHGLSRIITFISNATHLGAAPAHSITFISNKCIIIRSSVNRAATTGRRSSTADPPAANTYRIPRIRVQWSGSRVQRGGNGRTE